MGCIAALVSRRHLLADVDTLGGYTLEHCSLDAFAQLDNAAVRALNLLPDPRFATPPHPPPPPERELAGLAVFTTVGAFTGTLDVLDLFTRC